MKINTTIRTYDRLTRLESFEERFDYAKVGGIVGNETFGGHRYLNQILYSSAAWKSARRECILRDESTDLAMGEGYEIYGKVYVHHLNPITIDDILEEKMWVFDPDFLVCVSLDTHNALHYGDILTTKKQKPIIRTEFDTCPWKRR